MKRINRLLLTLMLAVTIALTASITACALTTNTVTAAKSTTALGAEYTYMADDLKALGLFGGTNKGYELERVPTRVEASVMLIRLLGKEKEALATTAKDPFSDVPAWADKYIAYMADQKLTGGIGRGKFGSSADCSAQMYATFLLRAVGYDDTNGDFEYATALDSAVTLKVVDQGSINEGVLKFNRGEMVCFSYNALVAKMKDSDKMLIEKLNEEGALTKAAADKILPVIKFYTEMANKPATDSNVKSMTMNGSMKMSMTLLGQTTDMLTMNMDMLMNLPEDGNFEANVSVKADVNPALAGKDAPTTENVTCYIKDGKLYMDDGTNKMVQEIPGLSDIAAIKNSASASNVSLLPILGFIDSVTTEQVGTDTTYTIALNINRLMAMTDTTSLAGLDAGLIPADTGKTEFTNAVLKITVDANGQVVGENVNFAAKSGTTTISMVLDGTFTYNADGSFSFKMDINMDILQESPQATMEMTMTGTFTGTASVEPVTIPAPDLTGYKPMAS